MKKKFITKGIYSSGMVLQRNTINCIFGCGEKAAPVQMKFRGKTYSSEVNNAGEWKIEYNPGSEGGPFTMELSSNAESITFTDVYVGEVWVNSGQSNAELPMVRLRYTYKDEYELPPNPQIRMIHIPIRASLNQEMDSIENPEWLGAAPDTLDQMSGTAYFFAKKLQSELKMPVGIINASQGGSPIASWLSEDFIRSKQDSLEYYKNLQFWQNPKNVEEKKADLASKQSEWDKEINAADLGNKKDWKNLSWSQIDDTWTDCNIPGELSCQNSAGILWLKKEIILDAKQVEKFNRYKTWLWLGTIVDADIAYVNGTQVGTTGYCYPPRRYVVPKGILKEGSNTITIRVQKNGAWGTIRFFEEKPYYLFTDNVDVCPVSLRNVEQRTSVIMPSDGDGEIVDLTGTWKCKLGCKVRNSPPQMFFEWLPAALFNGMLAPCFNYAVAGALWYQGESDTGIPLLYKDLLKSMMNIWRERFVYKTNGMPFVVMQLPNWAEGYLSYFKHDDWAFMREAQAKAAAESEKAAFAVTIDAGEWNDLHPEKKRTGGTRAALEALRIGYNKPVNPAPVMEYCQRNKEYFEVRFNSGNAKLCAYEVKTLNSEIDALAADFTKPSDDVKGFTFLLSNGSTVKAHAKLVSGDDIEVYLPEGGVAEGVALKELQYLWANNPEVVNLYSSDSIPAAPFRVTLS